MADTFSGDSTIYASIISKYSDTGSVAKTAKELHISEVRVRRVLITEGLWSSKTSEEIQNYLAQGLDAAAIAERMSTTEKAVQQYMPYKRGMYRQEHPSADALHSAGYRTRIKNVRERILRKDNTMKNKGSWEERIRTDEKDVLEEILKTLEELVERTEIPEFPQYPGIVCMRELPEDQQPTRSRMKGSLADVVRLHLELRRDNNCYNDYEDDGKQKFIPQTEEEREHTRVLQSYGCVRHGDTITRDILVPSNIPLFALHYVIQQAFGWQNSHLHRFELPPYYFQRITNDHAEKYLSLVGLLFRSPWMEEGDRFWTDDYENGSFKKWLRNKYTGPWLSLCHGEGIIQSAKDVDEIRSRIKKVLLEYSEHDGKLYVADARPVDEGIETGEYEIQEGQNEKWFGHVLKAEVCELDDCNLDVLQKIFMESWVNEILERLPLEEVLEFHEKDLTDELTEELPCCYEELVSEELLEEVEEFLDDGGDAPDAQPMMDPVTDVLYYCYDFGDDWRVRITGSLDACDLVEAGIVTQNDLDRAIRKTLETYRPQCIAADGLPLVDDAGGLDGYIRFLRSLNPTAEKAYWGKDNIPDNWSYEDKKGSLEWARSLGWKDYVRPETLL